MPIPLRAVRAPAGAIPAQLRRAWDAGEAVLPLDPAAPDRAIARILAVARPASLVTVAPDGGASTTDLDDPRRVDDDLALVVATSGSTGRPKAVALPRRAVDASTAAGLARLGARAGDRWALALPTHHVAGLQVILRAWHLGTDPVLAGDLRALADITAEYVALVPTQLRRLLDAGVDVARFQTILLGGARADAQLLARAREAGATVVTSYGMTETCGGCVYDGLPLADVEVALRDDGRVRLRGPVLCRGYLDDRGDVEPAVDPDGWFTTGDVGRLATSGRLAVLGRADDVIVSGGENVPLPAVAEVLRSHPGVADVAVVGEPDPDWGERVVAVVVPTDAAAPPQVAALRAHVTASQPAAYAPKRVVLVDALPRDRMGKVTRAGLAALVAAAEAGS